MENNLPLLASQLMVVTLIDTLLQKNSFNEPALEALSNARAVAAQVIDNLIKEHPELEEVSKTTLNSFSSKTPSKKKAATKKNG